MESTTYPAPEAPQKAPPRAGAAAKRRGADPYDTLLWRLQPRVEERLGGGCLLGVTGCDSRAGVSTVATNLAIRAADNLQRPALLVDANSVSPRLARSFQLKKAKGLADLLAGECDLNEAAHESRVDGLQIMPMGSKGLIDRIGIDHRIVDNLLESLRESFEMVVFDLPSVAEMRQMLLIARRLDGVVMAVRSEATPAGRLQESAETLADDGVPVVGSVLTRRKHYTPGWLRRWL
ncbi:MAG: CpsD/CapB family tyrosine-protein kinase [Planctomycetota bacterium]